MISQAEVALRAVITPLIAVQSGVEEAKVIALADFADAEIITGVRYARVPGMEVLNSLPAMVAVITSLGLVGVEAPAAKLIGINWSSLRSAGCV